MRYSYIAKSLTGEEETGTLEAKDTQQLAKILKTQGFILVKATPEEVKKRKLDLSIPFLGGVSLTEKMMFAKNLEVMLNAGLSLPRALETLSEQTTNKKFKKALFETKERIVKGESFSEALKDYPSIFSELFQSMIKVGEESGTLDKSLKSISQQMEREHELQSKIKGALIYPAVIIVAMLSIGVLMLVMVIPKLAETFKELGVELPVTTRLVIALGVFLAERWYLVLIFFLLSPVLFVWIQRIKIIKKAFDKFSLKLPVISLLIQKSNCANTTRTLSSLISAGVPIVKSLEIVSGSLGNFYYKNAISQAAEKVRKGEKLSEAIKPYQGLYPLIVIQMIQIGEETGETSSILGRLADFFEEEVSNATKNLASIIEPVLMLLIGAAVGFFAISMVQPMYSMLQTI